MMFVPTIGCLLMVVGALTLVRWGIKAADWIEGWRHHRDLGEVSRSKLAELKFGGKRR